MPYKTGTWGPDEKKRAKRRSPYFSEYGKRKRRGQYENRTLGYRGELEALDILKGAAHRRGFYDLDWKGFKVDVKTAIRGTRDRWQFTIRQQKGSIDYFLCIAKDRRYRTIGVFLIPDSEVTQGRILGMTRKSMAGRYAPFQLGRR